MTEEPRPETPPVDPNFKEQKWFWIEEPKKPFQKPLKEGDPDDDDVEEIVW